MSSYEKLLLKWNDFQENISTAFTNLRVEGEFTDVTLVCEDNQRIEAHRVILSASSPFFKNILTSLKSPNPLVYMRGVTLNNLCSIIDFIYFGEANVYQENLDSFLAVAEELQLKGLMGSGAEGEAEENLHPETKKKTPKQVQPKTIFPQESPEHEKVNQVHKSRPEPPLEGAVAVTDILYYTI